VCVLMGGEKKKGGREGRKRGEELRGEGEWTPFVKKKRISTPVFEKKREALFIEIVEKKRGRKFGETQKKLVP